MFTKDRFEMKKKVMVSFCGPYFKHTKTVLSHCIWNYGYNSKQNPGLIRSSQFRQRRFYRNVL